LSVIAWSSGGNEVRRAETAGWIAFEGRAIVQISVKALRSGRWVWGADSSLATSDTEIRVSSSGRRLAFCSVWFRELFAQSSAWRARDITALCAGGTFVNSLAVSRSVANIINRASVSIVAWSGEGELAVDTAVFVVWDSYVISIVAYLSRFNNSISANALSSLARSARAKVIFVRNKSVIQTAI